MNLLNYRKLNPDRQVAMPTKRTAGRSGRQNSEWQFERLFSLPVLTKMNSGIAYDNHSKNYVGILERDL